MSRRAGRQAVLLRAAFLSFLVVAPILGCGGGGDAPGRENESALQGQGGSGGPPPPPPLCTATSGPITLSVTANRTSGVGPLSVFFNATATTHTNPAIRPFHDLEYRWNFDSSNPKIGSGGTWGFGSRQGVSEQDAALGPVAAHVFETPGVYTVRLDITDGTSTVSTSCIQITVVDPNTLNTVCISATSTPTAGFDSCPAGATGVQQADWPTIIATYATAGRRVLLKAGDVFNGPATASLSSSGPLIIGSYGAGKATIRTTTTSDFSTILSIGGTASDIRVANLIIDGQLDVHRQGIRIAGASVSNILVFNTDIKDLGSGFDCILSQNSALPDGIFIVGSTISRINNGANNAIGHGIGIAGSRIAILGSSVYDTINAQHPLRVYYADRGVISNNRFGRGFTNGETVTIRSATFDDRVTVPYLSFPITSNVIVSDNEYETTGNVGATIKPTRPDFVERIQQVISERNWYWLPVGTVGSTGLQVQGSGVTVRNEIIDLTNSAGARIGVAVIGSGTSSPASNGVAVQHISSYSADVAPAGNYTGVFIQAGATGSSVQNVLAYAPNVANVTTVSDAGTGTTGSSGILGNSTNAEVKVDPGWTISSPMTPLTNFRPSTYPVGRGVAVSTWSDFFLDAQPTPRDSGAVIH